MAVAVAMAATAAEEPAIAAPLIVPGEVAGFGIGVLGRLQGDTFRPRIVRTPPAHDPATRRLHHISLARRQLETIDIADPTRPVRIAAFGDADGRFGIPTAVVVIPGGLALATMPRAHHRPGRVFFLTGDGRELAPPVVVGVRPWVMVATPDRRRLVVANAGEPDGQGADPDGSISIITLAGAEGAAATATVVNLGFDAWEERRQALIADGVRLAAPQGRVAAAIEPQGIAVAGDGRAAWVTLQRNNALAVVDLERPAIVAIRGLGASDHARPGFGLDPSDQDGRIAIAGWPVSGLYQPDGIAAWDDGAATWLITANEGDPRDDNADEARLADLVLDPAAYPDRAIGDKTALGRLRLSRRDGDGDGDGDIDRLHAFGARSLAVWTATGERVFETGDALERLIARVLPAAFNVADDNIRFDDRSDDRGPEPEQVAIGRLAGRPFAFATLERVGGVVAFALDDPARPRFAGYVNSRNFAVDPALVCRRGESIDAACRAAGDLEPETLLVMPESASSLILVVTHKSSDSLVLFRFTLAGD